MQVVAPIAWFLMPRVRVRLIGIVLISTLISYVFLLIRCHNIMNTCSFGSMGLVSHMSGVRFMNNMTCSAKAVLL